MPNHNISSKKEAALKKGTAAKGKKSNLKAGSKTKKGAAGAQMKKGAANSNLMAGAQMKKGKANSNLMAGAGAQLKIYKVASGYVFGKGLGWAWKSSMASKKASKRKDQ